MHTPESVIELARKKWPNASKIQVEQTWLLPDGLLEIGLCVTIPGNHLGDNPFLTAPTLAKLAALIEEIE